MYVTKEAIERVRRSQDLVAVIESRGVKLTRRGKNFVGLCPFHEDRKPSLVVNPERQLWNCFGACKTRGGKSGGDVFTFVAQKDGVSFLDAMRRLGYEEPKGSAGEKSAPSSRSGRRKPAAPLAEAPPARPPVGDVREPMTPNRSELLRRVVEHYHRTLRENGEGQRYLEGRGLLDPPLLTAFEVGYADGSLVETIAQEGEVARALKDLGVLTSRGREHFEGCVVFPLTLPDVGVMGLYGRHATRDQHLFLPGLRRGVFGWQAMKASGEII
jgi:DNA primase